MANATTYKDIAGQWCGDVTDYVFAPDTLTVKFHDSRPHVRTRTVGKWRAPRQMKTSARTVVECAEKRRLNLTSVEIFDRAVETRAGGVPATQRASQLFGQPTGDRPGVLVRA